MLIHHHKTIGLTSHAVIARSNIPPLFPRPITFPLCRTKLDLQPVRVVVQTTVYMAINWVHIHYAVVPKRQSCLEIEHDSSQDPNLNQLF